MVPRIKSGMRKWLCERRGHRYRRHECEASIGHEDNFWVECLRCERTWGKP